MVSSLVVAAVAAVETVPEMIVDVEEDGVEGRRKRGEKAAAEAAAVKASLVVRVAKAAAIAAEAVIMVVRVDLVVAAVLVAVPMVLAVVDLVKMVQIHPVEEVLKVEQLSLEVVDLTTSLFRAISLVPSRTITHNDK